MAFDRDSVKLSEQLLQAVAKYIDEHYVEVHRQVRRQRAVQTKGAWRMETLSMPTVLGEKKSLEAVLKEADAGFSETLLKMIDRSGKKDSEIYKRAGLTKQHFSKIRNNPDYRPTKPTAIALALALELNLDDTKDLIGRAGYALTNSSKFDLIIRYFIEQGKYDVVEINCVLYEYDQALLGG